MTKISNHSHHWVAAVESSIIPFWNFPANKEFIGVYVGPYDYKVGDTTEWSAHRFKKLDDETEWLIKDNYHITKAVDKNKVALYKITFLGTKQLDKNKEVNEYNVVIDKNWIEELPL